ncbi:hypothetical protein [Caenispirillum salinarum]|uniref:hypothetical protein n=1 Tax=Caenispirillum salinarum TaxID=859058 RepID=UPI00384D657C
MGKQETVSVEEYKRRAAELLDQMMSGVVSHVTVTDDGRVVAEMDGRRPPLAEGRRSIFGCMAGTVHIPPGVDLTEPFGD